MIPTLLITLREVIEASLVVTTILGILVKLKQKESIKTVWLATLAALLTSFLFVFFGSTVGINIQKLYSGNAEPAIEGALFILSSLFVTWAVFFLHHHFAREKIHLLQRINTTVLSKKQNGLFLLAFTAVLREGIEIALFLSTLYLTTARNSILIGFTVGAILGVAVSGILFHATINLPVRAAFRTTSFLLILFAGGLLARGVGEFLEFVPLPALPTLMFPFLPKSSSVIGGLIETIFGITRSMHAAAAISYTSYIFFMHHWVFIRSEKTED